MALNHLPADQGTNGPPPPLRTEGSTTAPDDGAADDPAPGPSASADPPLDASALDHDPGNALEHQVAERCVELAKLLAGNEALAGERTNPEPTAQDVREVLVAISSIADGSKSLDTIRGAPAAWLGATLSASRRFEADLRFVDAMAPTTGAGR